MYNLVLVVIIIVFREEYTSLRIVILAENMLQPEIIAATNNYLHNYN